MRPPLFDISIYKNIDKYVFFSSTEDIRGFPVIIEPPLKLDLPSVGQIGIFTKQGIQISQSNPLTKYVDNYLSSLKKATKLGSLASIGSIWKVINIICNIKSDWIVPAHTIKSGYTISPVKFRNGAYRGYKQDPDYYLPLTATDEELGETILKAFDVIETLPEEYV